MKWVLHWVYPTKEPALGSNKTAFLPELTRLLINVRCKIQSLRKTGKTRKGCWLIKRTTNEFNVNPYKARKNLLDFKCCSSLKIDQETLLDQYKSNIMDNNYHIPFGNLEGLPPEPWLLIILKNLIIAAFLMMIILKSCLDVEMPLHLF